jgi:hypothetical protein
MHFGKQNTQAEKLVSFKSECLVSGDMLKLL